MNTTNEIYTLIQGAERAVDQQRFELAQALAAIAQARALADIANACGMTTAIASPTSCITRAIRCTSLRTCWRLWLPNRG